MTTPPKHRSPSKDRYAASHPAVTVHFDLDDHARLLALRAASGLSFNQLIRAEFTSLESHVAAITEHGRQQGLAEGTKLGEAVGRKLGEAVGRKLGYEEGWKAGYLKAKARFRLTYPCDGCGKPVEVRIGNPDAERAIEALVDDAWGHADCLAP